MSRFFAAAAFLLALGAGASGQDNPYHVVLGWPQEDAR